jgi:hypothetical protein
VIDPVLVSSAPATLPVGEGADCGFDVVRVTVTFGDNSSDHEPALVRLTS